MAKTQLLAVALFTLCITSSLADVARDNLKLELKQKEASIEQKNQQQMEKIRTDPATLPDKQQLDNEQQRERLEQQRLEESQLKERTGLRLRLKSDRDIDAASKLNQQQLKFETQQQRQLLEFRMNQQIRSTQPTTGIPSVSESLD